MNNIKRASDGLVWQQGDYIALDTAVELNRLGEYKIHRALVDGVYFEHVNLEVSGLEEIEVEGVDEQSVIYIHRFRDIPREQKRGDYLPDIGASSGNPMIDGQMAFHEMFKQFAEIYGLGKPDEMEKKMAAHLEKLAAEAEKQDVEEAEVSSE